MLFFVEPYGFFKFMLQNIYVLRGALVQSNPHVISLFNIPTLGSEIALGRIFLYT